MYYECKCGRKFKLTENTKKCACGLDVDFENESSGAFTNVQDEVSTRIDTIAEEAASATQEMMAVGQDDFKVLEQITEEKKKNAGSVHSSPNTPKAHPQTSFESVGDDRKKQAAGGHASQHTAKEHDFKNLEQIARAYETTGKSKYIHAALDSFGKNVALLNMENNWRPFFVEVARIAIEKDDVELQTYLKIRAKDYDKERGDSDLFYRLFSACPNLLSNNDWMGLIKEANGDSHAFSKICEPLIRYIAQTCDRSFAIDVFKYLRKRGKKDEGWATLCKEYARALFSNKAIAENVFTKSVFFKQGNARKFAKQCRSGLHGTVAIEATRVWENYVAAVKMMKGLAMAGFFAVIAVIVAGLIAFYMYLSSVDKNTVSFTVDKIIEVTYGDKISLDGYYLTYRTHGGDDSKEPLTESMLVGYDPESVGSQQSAYFEFQGVKEPVTIIVKATQLDTPKLTQSGNYITWETVPYAESYAIFVNASEVKTNEISGLRFDLSEISAFGELTVTVRAMSHSGKYIASEMSAPLTVTKLEAPKNIEYSSGKLTWNAVEGATGYELTVNGIPYFAAAPECMLSFNRGFNEVTIIAKSSDPSVIPGVSTKSNMYYNQLDPITSMAYRDGTVSWQASADAKIFRVYVDGVQWKDFSRSNFSFENDGFAKDFGNGTHKIEIVCMTSVSGVENSEKAGYNVVFGNKASMNNGLISWQNIGVGSTYFVYVNDTLYTYSDSYFSTSDCTWQSGMNEVSIIAKLSGEEYICESFTVKKQVAPTISVADMGWFLENTGYELYSLNGREWTSTLPDISTIAAGTHIIKAKRTVSAPDAFEIESDTVQITVNKPKAPAIRLNAGVIECSVFDSESLELMLEYYDADIASWISINSVEALIHAGEYRIRAYFRTKANVGGYDFCISSDRSAEIKALKPAAPNVIYDAATGRLSSSVPGAKFYYTDENGKEHEIPEGKVSNLPGGVFKVYARLNATDSNTLNSQNTPTQEQISVFNMDIEFMVTPIAGSNQCNLVFSGCNDIDSITYSYQIKYLDASGQVIGGLDKSNSFVTQGKTNPSSDTIVCLINYRIGGEFNGSYTHSDVSKIEVTVFIDGGTETLQKSYTVSVK